jgi:hypothetical protein
MENFQNLAGNSINFFGDFQNKLGAPKRIESRNCMGLAYCSCAIVFPDDIDQGFPIQGIDWREFKI